MNIVKRYFRSTDWILYLATAVASIYGIILVYSACLNLSTGSRNFMVQCIGVAVGIVAMVVISLIDYRLFGDLWLIVFGVTCAALVITILIGTGPTGSGNRNWINLGFFNLQTSEFTKYTFIVMIAALIDRFGEAINRFTNILIIVGCVGVTCVLLLVTGDLGMTVIYFCIAVIMLFCAGLKIWYFLLALGGICAVFPLAWKFVLKDYMKQRILVGFNPQLDPAGYGYQAIQGSTAIGSGGFSGNGFGNGTMIQSGSVPAHWTDFIASVAGEEFGFIGMVLLITVLLAVMFRIWQLSRNAGNTMGSMICIGVFGVFLVQTFVNIFMCIGMFPVIGITLPFFSYGGSSILSTFCAIGLVQSVVRHNREFSFSRY